MKTEFWSICNETLHSILNEDFLNARVSLAKANARITEAKSPSVQQARRKLVEHYDKLIRKEFQKNGIASQEVSSRQKNKKRLSLVTSVFNRHWQLKKTLSHNLATIRGNTEIEIVLVDFGGGDSPDISKMIEDQYCFDLISGNLKYWRITEPWKKFHMATAKNVAHRLATGCFLMSVDADNYINEDDLDIILDHFNRFPEAIFHQTIGPAPLSHIQWSKYNLFESSTDYHNNDLVWDGSCGRIGVSRDRFESVNGYNENFVGMGMDDIDFIIRSIRSGADYRHTNINRPAEEVYIDNGSAAKDHKHENNDNNWKFMDTALSNGVYYPIYKTSSPLNLFTEYISAAVHESDNTRVTLFSSAFRASAYIDRFEHDLNEILASTDDAVIWLLDVVGSHSKEITERLRSLSHHNRVFYFPVYKDPGLYELWNTAIRNIRSKYVGNLNIDDLRGREWLPSCLSLLDANLADLASPVTVPFDDDVVTSYQVALSELRKAGKSEQRWFETRVTINGSSETAKPSHSKLIDGFYDHRDLFQVLPEGKLSSYCIPNASPVWRRSLHERAGYFDENKYGCFADLALWINASANGLRLRQADYPALFFISPEQAHRRQEKDEQLLWSLALTRGSETLRTWAARRCFDLSRMGGSYGDHHFLGWNWVRDQVTSHFVDSPGNLLLDFFVERNFFWNPDPKEGNFQFNRNWLGFVHTTPHQNEVYDHKGQNLDCLLEEPRFQFSLPTCKGLIVLSEENRVYLSSHLEREKWNIPVFKLFHPNIPMNTNNADILSSDDQSILSSMFFHIGWHLRSFAAFARLGVNRKFKTLLVPKKLSKEYFIKEVVNKDLALAGLKPIEEYVEHIYTASNEDYQRILRWGIIFNYYHQPSGSNLISECISSGAALMINRHPAFEEYLGHDYPLFFNNQQEADELSRQLIKDGSRLEVRNHLQKREELFSIDRFIRELEKIGSHVYHNFINQD